MSNSHIRRDVDSDTSIVIQRCRVVIHHQPDFRQADFSYEYEMDKKGGSTLTEWLHVVPVHLNEVSDVSASDDVGGLATIVTSNNAKTHIQITLRSPDTETSKRRFKFQYKAPSSSLFLLSFFSETVVWTDFFYHLNPFNDLSIEINIQNGSKIKDAKPPTDGSSNPIKYNASNMAPLESLHLRLALKKNRIGKGFWIWLGTLVASGLFGWILTKIPWMNGTK